MSDCQLIETASAGPDMPHVVAVVGATGQLSLEPLAPPSKAGSGAGEVFERCGGRPKPGI